ncbi:MAG: hypothetical protein RI956_736, partial [Pseudomonadota bacterium]
ENLIKNGKNRVGLQTHKCKNGEVFTYYALKIIKFVFR